MFALGLVLLVVAGAVTLGVVLSNTSTISDASAFGVSISNVSIGGLFLAGAVAGLLLMLGLSLMVAGAARKRHRRVETKRTVKGVRSEREQLATENEQLRSELASSRADYPDQTVGDGTTRTTAVVEEKHGLFGKR